MEWSAQRSAGGAHEGSRWEAKRTHRIDAASGRAPEGAHEFWPIVHAPRWGAAGLWTLTGGCGSPEGRTFPPATFIGPSGAGTRLSQLPFHRNHKTHPSDPVFGVRVKRKRAAARRPFANALKVFGRVNSSASSRGRSQCTASCPARSCPSCIRIRGRCCR